MKTKKKIIGIGEILWDVFPEGRRLGGAPANFAFHSHAMGYETAIVSAVGQDEDGDALISRLETLSMNTAYIQRDSVHATGTVHVTVDDKGIPEYDITANAAWDYIQWTPQLEKYAQQADAVCFGTLGQRGLDSRATIRKCLAFVPDSCLRVCDVNLRLHFYTQEILLTSLALSDVIKINDEEAPVLMQAAEIKAETTEAMEALADKYDLEAVVLTRGEKGSVILYKGEKSEHPGVAAKCVDTVGAGDAFTACVIDGLLNEKPVDEINERANRVAARVCAYSGATPEIEYQ